MQATTTNTPFWLFTAAGKMSVGDGNEYRNDYLDYKNVQYNYKNMGLTPKEGARIELKKRVNFTKKHFNGVYDKGHLHYMRNKATCLSAEDKCSFDLDTLMLLYATNKANDRNNRKYNRW